MSYADLGSAQRLTSNGTYEEGGDYWLWLDMAGNRWRRDDPVGDDNMTTVTHLNDLIQWQVAPGGDCKAIKLNPGASQPAPAVDANAVPNGTAAAFDGTVGQVWDAPRGAKPPLRAEGMAWIVGDNAKSGWTAPPMLQSACTIHYPACPHGTAQQYACVEVGTRDFSKGLAPTYDDDAVFAKPDGCPDKPTVTKELADVQRGRFGGDLAGW